MVQLLNEMLAAFLIILVALDARLDMACVGLARIRVRLIGHVQPVGATSSTLGKFAADHVASHAEFGQTRALAFGCGGNKCGPTRKPTGPTRDAHRAATLVCALLPCTNQMPGPVGW